MPLLSMPLRPLLSVAFIAATAVTAGAAQIGPPMFDVTRQCDIASRHNATAMSECIVAESEARADLLQNWAKYSDDGAERCIKAGRKAVRRPYAAMAKCMSPELTAHGKAAQGATR